MRFVLYSRLTLRGRRWFWRLKAGNGEIVAHGSTRGYSRRIDAETAIGLVRASGAAFGPDPQ
jgi:uncharacterized protein YegP (UPF0339 family)